MIRWTLGALALVLALGVVTVALARFLGKSGSRASVLVSVVSAWLGAYVLWTFAGGLALHYGWLARYDAAWFGLIALAGAVAHYRAAWRRGREHGLTVFVGGQLLWLVIVLVQNGAFRD